MTTVPAQVSSVSRPRERTIPLPRLLAAWSVLLGGLIGFWFLRPYFGTREWNLGQVLILYNTSKIATLLCLSAADRRSLSWGVLIAYLFWPGMQPRLFLPRHTPGDEVVPTWRGFLLNLLAGIVFLWLLPAILPEQTPLFVRVWLGFVGFSFLFFFALMDLYALVYRRMGFAVGKLWVAPIAATSLNDFWSRRWNRIFSGMLRDTLFLPLARRKVSGVSPSSGRANGARHLSARLALLAVFLYSGLLHENISVAARSGYGQPILYFLLQFAGLSLESVRPIQRLFQRHPIVGWVWTFAVAIVPLPLLLHTGFIESVWLPSLVELGVPGLPT